MPEVDFFFDVRGWHQAAPRMRELRAKLAQAGLAPMSTAIVSGKRGLADRLRVTCRFGYASEAEAEQATIIGAMRV